MPQERDLRGCSGTRLTKGKEKRNERVKAASSTKKGLGTEGGGEKLNRRELTAEGWLF